MEIKDLMEKAKADNDLTTYETLQNAQTAIDTLSAQLEDEKTKHEEELKGRDTEIESLKAKTWELLTRGNPEAKPKEEPKPKAKTASDIVSKWKNKSY